MRTDGVDALLELYVDAKSWRSAAGAPVDVLHDIRLRLEPGECVALTGPSGCGKTTLLRIAAGLDDDFTGRRSVGGHGRLAMVFQEPRLLPWRSVEENVRLVLTEDERTADLDGLFDALDLGAHRNHYPGELSLGLARRVAIARAFATKPDVLLLDEPFVSLDPSLALRLRAELAALIARTRVTTLLVTHDLSEAVELADRIVILSARPARIVAEKILPPRERRDEGMRRALVETLSKPEDGDA